MTDDHIILNDYDDFIAEIAENNRDRDGSPPGYVANHVIVSVERIDDDSGYAFTFNARPYTDNRVWPSQFVEARPDYPFKPGFDVESLRALCVEMLRQDLVAYYEKHGWEQAGGAIVQKDNQSE
jgi:hypothetical protein